MYGVCQPAKDTRSALLHFSQNSNLKFSASAIALLLMVCIASTIFYLTIGSGVLVLQGLLVDPFG